MEINDWKNMYWDQVRKRKEGIWISDYSFQENDYKYLLDENIILKKQIRRLHGLVDVDNLELEKEELKKLS